MDSVKANGNEEAEKSNGRAQLQYVSVVQKLFEFMKHPNNSHICGDYSALPKIDI